MEIKEVFVMRPTEPLPTFLNNIRVIETIDSKEDNREINKQEYEPDKHPF